MKFIPNRRVFALPYDPPLSLTDCGSIELEADEQVTFTTETGAEYDLCRKSWGFYATPSLNKRLPSFGLRAALIADRSDKYAVVLVEGGKEPEFHKYLTVYEYRLISWMDTDAALQALEVKPQVLKCLRGEHEECGRGVFQMNSGSLEANGFGVPTQEVRFCKHCRAMYVPRTNLQGLWRWVEHVDLENAATPR